MTPIDKSICLNDKDLMEYEETYQKLNVQPSALFNILQTVIVSVKMLFKGGGRDLTFAEMARMQSLQPAPTEESLEREYLQQQLLEKTKRFLPGPG